GQKIARQSFGFEKGVKKQSGGLCLARGRLRRIHPLFASLASTSARVCAWSLHFIRFHGKPATHRQRCLHLFNRLDLRVYFFAILYNVKKDRIRGPLLF
ncbi:MAG: hypothetical protein J6K80_00105, partial [Oscillospiraceae bacterium]|nr:hypothetical protein [Oscillospiraceae bacterium]